MPNPLVRSTKWASGTVKLSSRLEQSLGSTCFLQLHLTFTQLAEPSSEEGPRTDCPGGCRVGSCPSHRVSSSMMRMRSCIASQLKRLVEHPDMGFAWTDWQHWHLKATYARGESYGSVPPGCVGSKVAPHRARMVQLRVAIVGGGSVQAHRERLPVLLQPPLALPVAHQQRPLRTDAMVFECLASCMRTSPVWHGVVRSPIRNDC
jgi:hypothetical protein